MVPKEEESGGGKDWEFGISRCKLLYREWIDNKVLSYSTGNCIQYPVKVTPDGPVVKNLPTNAGDTGSIPGGGTKIPHAAGQLSPLAAATEPARHNYREACVPQRKIPRAAMKIPCVATKTQNSQK